MRGGAVAVPNCVFGRAKKNPVAPGEALGAWHLLSLQGSPCMQLDATSAWAWGCRGAQSSTATQHINVHGGPCITPALPPFHAS